eukprot:scaffold15964_cov135-Isochrysis_galbana.AAC.1
MNRIVNVHRYRRGGVSCEFTGVPAGGHRGEGHSHVPARGAPGVNGGNPSKKQKMGLFQG